MIQKSVIPKTSFIKKFSCIGDDFVDLLKGMLEFNPQKRYTAKACLDHKVFADIKDPQLEFLAPCKIKVHDQDSSGFDYENFTERLKIEECIVSLEEELDLCEKYVKTIVHAYKKK